MPSASDQGVRISGGIDLVRPKLTETDQQLLDDHRQCGHFLIEHEGDYCYIVTLKRKVGFPRRSISHFVASDILHCSNGSIASRHWTRLCELIRGQDRSLAVIADERFFPKERPEGLSLPYNSFFHAQTEIETTEIDTLYTELPLLGLGFSPSALAVK